MKKLVLLLACAIFASAIISAPPAVATAPAPPSEQTIFDRIEWLRELRPLIARHWSSFDGAASDVPLVYYTDSVCYAVNPTDRFLSQHAAALVFESRGTKIFKTPLLDDTPFHMSVSLAVGTPSDDFDYRAPHILCSSFEVTRATIPGTESLNEWGLMVMHEYFHGFQLSHPEFLDHYERVVLTSPPQDTLKRLYRNHEWFRESIDRENELLLKALEVTDRNQIHALTTEFFALREKRRARAISEAGFDGAPLERLYETMEGTARYVEWALAGDLDHDPQSHEINPDPCEIPAWLWATQKTSWYYATGFNLVRLLEKFGSDFDSRLFVSAPDVEQLVREII